MSLELLKRIEAAESKADEARAEAQREARDVIQSVETACVVHEREAVLEHRALGQRIVEDAKETAMRRNASMEKEQAAKRDAVRGAARQKLDTASQFIFERIVNDGHR